MRKRKPMRDELADVTFQSIERGLRTILAGKELLIFDFDGTVADTSSLHERAFVDVLAPYQLAVDYSSIAGMKTSDAMRRIFSAANMAISEDELAGLVARKQAGVRVLIEQGLEALPGMDTLLRHLRERFRLAMVTSGSRLTVNLALRKLGYENLFDPLVCAEDVSRTKPDPEGFQQALRIASVEHSMALVFEDSAAGFAGATAAGIDFVDVGAFLLARR